MPSRRSFLQAGLAALAARSLGCATDTSGGPAAPWGTPPEGGADVLPAEALRPRGVLELFLPGGMNAWDTFYVIPEFGDPAAGGEFAGTMWHSFQRSEGGISVPEQFERCGGAGRDLLQAFGPDSAGRTVHLGPFVLALRDRPDLLARMRILVTRHGQAPHQTAIPLALCGHRFGSPRLTGTATHVQRFHQERDPRAAPHAYVLYPGLYDLGQFNADVGTAIGRHRGIARPLELNLRFMDRITTQLARTTPTGDLADLDRAVRHYAATYTARLTPPDRDRVLARVMDDYAFAREAMGTAPRLTGLFDESLQVGPPGEACGHENSPDDTEHGLAVAVSLLTRATTPARWVTSIDGGLDVAEAGLSYDTHAFHVRDGGRNVTHAMRRLAAHVNEPGEGDPAKLDLDRHMVLISTEFGRTPFREGPDGLDHWPDGFVQVVLGGPVGPDQAGVVGAIGEDGVATDWITPAELRAALLHAQGIWPFSPEAFAVGDLRDVTTERDAAVRLRERVWGRT